MKNQFSLILLFILSVAVFSQTKKTEENPNFSGTWILDNKKSATFINDQRMPDPFDCHTEMIISQTDSIIVMNFSDLCREKTKAGIQNKEIKIEKKYFVDKRGEINRNTLNEVIYSETELKKNSLVIKEYEDGGRNKKGKLTAELEYQLSKDRNNLSVRIEYKGNFPNQMNPIKQYSQLVYKLKK